MIETIDQGQQSRRLILTDDQDGRIQIDNQTR